MCSLSQDIAQSKHDLLQMFVGVDFVLNRLLYNAEGLLLIHWLNMLPTFVVYGGCLMH